MESKRLKLGLALSGAAARSSFYIGFLEVLKENEIQIDCIAAQSGAAMVATCFACGTLEAFKQEMFAMNTSRLFDLFLVRGSGSGGIYSLDRAEEYGREHWSLGKRFEDVSPRLCFIATDLEKGEPVCLGMGDLARACRHSCAIPGVFQPSSWGGKTLIDGGLVSFIPGHFARECGADVVVGVNVRATEHIFPKGWRKLRAWYTWSKGKLGLTEAGKFWKKAKEKVGSYEFLDPLEALVEQKKFPVTALGVLGRALDIAILASAKTALEKDNYGCDLLIRSDSGSLGGNIRISDMQRLYEEGRKSASDNLENIKKLLTLNI